MIVSSGTQTNSTLQAILLDSWTGLGDRRVTFSTKPGVL